MMNIQRKLNDENEKIRKKQREKNEENK